MIFGLTALDAPNSAKSAQHFKVALSVVYWVSDKGKQDSQYTYNVIFRRVHAAIVAVGKAIRMIYSECVFSPSYPAKKKRMARIILPSVATPAVPYFSTLSHTWRNFQKTKNFIEYKMCFSISL